MTDVFSWMEYPHWLIVGGVALLTLSLIGRAFQREAAEASTSGKANRQDALKLEDDLDRVEVYNRAAKEKRKARWTESSSEIEEPSAAERQNLASSP